MPSETLSWALRHRVELPDVVAVGVALVPALVVAVGLLPGLVAVAGIVVAGVLAGALLAAVCDGWADPLPDGAPEAGADEAPEAGAPLALVLAPADGGGDDVVVEEADEPPWDEQAVSARAEPRTNAAADVRVMSLLGEASGAAPALPESTPYDADHGRRVVVRACERGLCCSSR